MTFYYKNILEKLLIIVLNLKDLLFLKSEKYA